MADIELVVKLSEEDYKEVLDTNNHDGRWNCMHSCYEAILDGTPLPKGHGRIADIDKVLEEMKATRTYDIPFALERVKPIIEADKTEIKPKENEE